MDDKDDTLCNSYHTRVRVWENTVHIVLTVPNLGRAGRVGRVGCTSVGGTNSHTIQVRKGCAHVNSLVATRAPEAGTTGHLRVRGHGHASISLPGTLQMPPES